MTIDSIDLFHVRMPLLEPWRTAYGSDDAIESILVRMCADGLVGWGESCPLAMPCYSPEYAGGVFGVLRDCLVPRLIGETINSGEDLQAKLQMFKGNYFAKGAMDTAWCDIHAKMQGEPLWRVLGGRSPTLKAGADFGIRNSVEELIELVGDAVRSGAPRIKLKYAPHWGFPIVEKIRESFPGAVLHIDCNASYSLSDRAMFQELDRLELAMFEQPLSFTDLADHAALQWAVRTPVCLDESINSVQTMHQAITLKSCRWVNIKPGRVGGLTVARQIHDLCQSAGIPCWVGGMLESSVGAHHCAALATLPNFHYPPDLFPSSRFYANDLSEPAATFASPWTLTLPEGPGVGASPDPARLKKWTLQKASFGGGVGFASPPESHGHSEINSDP